MQASIRKLIRKLYREPLLHFLVLALGLFGLHHLIAHEDTAGDSRRIVVDRENLLNFIQYRSKSFDAGTARSQLESFSGEQLQKLVADYVREEALYREARSLGLGDNDYVIKRRLIQKIDYIARGFSSSFDQVGEEEIRNYFAEHREDYYVKPSITFTHIFFSTDRHGIEGAQELARETLSRVNGNGAGFNDAGSYGERFLYGLNFIERSESFVDGRFGEAFASTLFTLEPGTRHWQGPVLSDHGVHLVLVKARQAGYLPELSEVYTRVAQEAQRAITASRARQATQQIVDSYQVDMRYEPPRDALARLQHKGN